MNDIFPPRIPGINLMVGSFLPRLRLSSLAGPKLAPVDLVEEGTLGICIYNPGAVNPFPLPPRGVDLPRRLAMLQERDVSLYVISGLGLPGLSSWMEMVGADIHSLSDADGEFTQTVGIPIKQVEGRNFRTHMSFILQEDRVLTMLLEADPVHDFERVLVALDVAANQPVGEYDLPDKPWYYRRPEYLDDELLSELEP